jgi:hypothetical protein
MNRSTVTASVATAALAGTAALALAAPALAGVVRSSGEVTRYDHAAPKVDVPAGGSARVQSVETADGKTIVTLDVTGFRAFGQYGAHAHNAACGDPATDPKGLAAKGHFQYVVDPVQPRSTRPSPTRATRSGWTLTPPRGEGHAKAVVDWQFPRPRAPLGHHPRERRPAPRGGTARPAAWPAARRLPDVDF